MRILTTTNIDHEGLPTQNRTTSHREKNKNKNINNYFLSSKSYVNKQFKFGPNERILVKKAFNTNTTTKFTQLSTTRSNHNRVTFDSSNKPFFQFNQLKDKLNQKDYNFMKFDMMVVKRPKTKYIIKRKKESKDKDLRDSSTNIKKNKNIFTFKVAQAVTKFNKLKRQVRESSKKKEENYHLDPRKSPLMDKTIISLNGKKY